MTDKLTIEKTPWHNIESIMPESEITQQDADNFNRQKKLRNVKKKK